MGAAVVALVVTTGVAAAQLARVGDLRARSDAVDSALDRAEEALIGAGAHADPDAPGPAAGHLAGELTAAAAGLEAHASVIGDDVVAAVAEAAAVGRCENVTASPVDPRPGAGGPSLVDVVLDASLALSRAEARLDSGLELDLDRTRWVANIAMSAALAGWVTAAITLVWWRWRHKRRHLEAFYEEILDDLTDRVCLYRADDLRIEFCNRAWAAPFGRNRHELVGVPMTAVLGEGELGPLRIGLPQLLRGDEIRASIGRRTDPSGATLVESWDDDLIDRGDGVPRVLSVGREVTALLAAEAEARFVSENTSDVLMRVGLDRRVRFATQAVAPLLELSPADLEGAPLAMLIAPEHHAAVEDAIDAAVRTGGVQSCEVEAVAAAADVRIWCDFEVRSIVTGDGDDVELHVALRDISEHRRLTGELRAGRATLDAIVDAVPSGVIAYDRAGTVLAVNRAALALGRTHLDPGAEVRSIDLSHLELTTPAGDLITPDQMPFVRALASGEPVTLDAIVHFRDTGTVMPVVATSQAWRDDNGDVAGAVVVIHDVTEVKAAERQLRAILDAIRHGVLLHDDTGRVVAANAAAADLLGEADPAALIGVPTDAVLSDATDVDGTAVGTRFTPVSDTITSRRPTGPVEVGVGSVVDQRWLRVDAEPVTTDTGAGAVVSLTDVTREHDARFALAESEARHRAVVENLHEGLVVQDETGTIVSANTAAEEILGLSADQLAGRRSVDPGWRAVDADSRPLAGEAHPAMVSLRTGDAVEGFRMGVHRPDGQRRWIDVTSRPVALPTGPGVFTVFHDLTATLAAQAALAESEERFRSLADGAPIPVFTMSTDAGIDYANAALCELIRAPFGRVEGFGWLDFLADDERDDLASIAVHAATDSVQVFREHQVLPVDDAPRYVATTLRPIDGGQRLIGTVIDLTERRALERRLAHDATHDTLTGLANRALLLDRLDQSLRRAARTGTTPTLLFIDLDHFKPVNDTHGHAAGDHVLTTIAQRIAHATRDGDTIARLGGDEFVTIAEPPATRRDVDTLATRLLEQITGPIDLPDGSIVTVGASIGIATGEIGDDPAALLARADTAVYDAKSSGRGRIHRSSARA